MAATCPVVLFRTPASSSKAGPLVEDGYGDVVMTEIRRWLNGRSDIGRVRALPYIC